MKTHADAKKTTPCRTSAPPTPNALAHKAQLRSALRRAGVQPRLEIGAVDDPLEREADAAAQRVMRMPKPAATLNLAQPKTAAAPTSATKASPSQASPQLESSLNSLNAGGSPLDAQSRAFFEPRFGQDFSQVRLHTDSAAGHMADSLNAKAFTLGNHIAFAPSSSHADRNLLGHELAHVVQQGGVGGGAVQGKLIQRQPDTDYRNEILIQSAGFKELDEENQRIVQEAYKNRSVYYDNLHQLLNDFRFQRLSQEAKRLILRLFKGNNQEENYKIACCINGVGGLLFNTFFQELDDRKQRQLLLLTLHETSVELHEISVDNIIRKYQNLVLAAKKAAGQTDSIVSEHKAQVKEKGKGKYYGSESSCAYDPKCDKSGLEEMNCILFQMKPVETYVRFLEESGTLKQDTWDAIRDATEDSRGKILSKRGKEIPNTDVLVGRDTVLMEQLRKRAGFKTVLIDRGAMVGKLTLSRAVEKADGYYPPTARHAKGADSGEQLDVRTGLDRIFKNTKEDHAAALEYLSSLPFAILAEDYGHHTLVLSFGKVYEAHWGEGPKSRKMFESKKLADYLKRHDNLVFAVPPGYAPPP